MNLESLSEFTLPDIEKREIIAEILRPPKVYELASNYYMAEGELCKSRIPVEDLNKYCPKCGREYPESENFCFECAVALKDKKYVNVSDIEISPVFNLDNPNELDTFEEIFSPDNLDRINEFNFTIDEFNEITNNIKITSLKTMDEAIKANGIYLDGLSALEKIILYVKSFVDVDYKSYGQELGYYEFGKITVDDRQLAGLQITTLLHELSHFLITETLTHVMCRILDCAKTTQMKSVATFILSYSPINRLLDEYAAHTVEGRFTIFGYQDYSSYLNIQKQIDLPEVEIEMVKTIGNSFANCFKEILESFIDEDLLEDIKDQFRKDVLDRPNYENLALENCVLLNEEGMIGALRFIIADGFAVSADNIDTLREYDSRW